MFEKSLNLLRLGGCSAMFFQLVTNKKLGVVIDGFEAETLDMKQDDDKT